MTLYFLLLIYLKVTMSKVYDLSLVDNIFDITIIFVHNNISIFAKKRAKSFFEITINQFFYFYFIYISHI